MFPHTDIAALKPDVANLSTAPRWYVSDEEYRAAVDRAMKLRSEVAFGLAKAAAGKFAGLFRGHGGRADEAGLIRDADGIHRLPGGSIDVAYYERLARREQARAMAGAARGIARWLGSAGGARRLRSRALAGG